MCEFTSGQIPGSSKFVGTRNFPTVYTVGYTLSEDARSADVTAQVIKTGSLIAETGSPSPINVSGILWGETPPTIDDFIGKTTDGRIDGQPFTINVLLPEQGRTLYVIAYATTAAGTFYGKLLTISQTEAVQSPFTFRYWMDRNLGATALPQSTTSPSSQDSASMGGLYQWGRKSDGHEIVLPRTFVSGSTYTFYSGTNPTRQSNWAVVSNQFYTNGSGTGTDWLTTSRNTLWQGLNGENNPCPTGFRVPTKNEFLNETNSFGIRTLDGAFTSFLRLPATGYRKSDGLSSNYVNYTNGRYWTSTIIGTTTAYVLSMTAGAGGDITDGTPTGRINGHAVRCIKGEASSGGNAVISGFTEGSSTGTLKLDQPVSGVTKTMYANVTKAGSYSINTLVGSAFGPLDNGVVFSGQGTLAVGNNQSITLTATGTPTSQNTEGNWQYRSNTDPFFNINTPIAGEPSTNGVAIVEGYTSINSSGGMTTSSPVNNVTQTIRANVTKTGTYFLKTTTTNGVRFAASGTFASIGNNDVILTATGTPISSGIFSYTLNTTPNVTFNRECGNPSTGGGSVVTNYTIGSYSEKMVAGVPVSGVTQTIIANVTTPGTYNISTFTNQGVTFAGSGTFTNTGNQNIILTATGTPTNYDGTYTFSLSTTPSATFSITHNGSSGGTALITWDNVAQTSLTTAQTTENNRNIVIETEASTYSPPFVQYMVVNVTRIGTYNINTIGNRTGEGHTLRLVGSGTFTSTGVQTIQLYYYGKALNNNGGNPLPHYFYVPRENYIPVLFRVRNSQ